jgi:serine/threonine-protein kinase
MTLQLGDTIDGKYKIVRLLGEGGMGSVYEGENLRIHRKVAIKVLHAAVAAKADVVQRFEREAQAAGRIGSEHIVEVLDLGNLPDGERFMVMEYLEGESLGDRIKRKKRMSPHEAAAVLHQLLEGLAAAHAAGIVHRDLKPDNVYLLTNKGGQKDFVKLLDFGVSKFNALDSEMSMTRTGAVMGTPFYMSPEQARGGKVDTRSDLYSVGVVVYQAVTGRVPFHAETFNELVFKIALESPEPAELVPGLDPSFAAIIVRSMVRDPAGRFQTAHEFQNAVAQWMMTAAPDGVGGTMPLQPGLRASMPGFGQSTPNAGGQSFSSNPSLGTSGAMGLGASGPGLNQSSPGNLSQSGGQLGGSQAGMAVTAPQSRGNGAMIAIGFAVVVLGAGGGFGLYQAFGKKAPAPVPTAVAATNAPVPSAKPTAPPPVETAPPATAPATAAPVEMAAATATTADAVAKVGGPMPKGKTPATPSATPSAKPTATPVTTAAPAKTGRVIDGQL